MNQSDEELSAQPHGQEPTMGFHWFITYVALSLLAIGQLGIGVALLCGWGSAPPFLSSLFDYAGASDDLTLRVANVVFGLLLIVLAVYALLCQRALRLRKEFAVGQLYSLLFFCMIWLFAYALGLAFVVPYSVGALRLVDGVVPFIVVLIACFQYYRTRVSYFCQPATSDSLLDRLGSVWLVFTRRSRTTAQEASERNLKTVMAVGFLVFIALLLIWLFASLA